MAGTMAEVMIFAFFLERDHAYRRIDGHDLGHGSVALLGEVPGQRIGRRGRGIRGGRGLCRCVGRKGKYGGHKERRARGNLLLLHGGLLFDNADRHPPRRCGARATIMSVACETSRAPAIRYWTLGQSPKTRVSRLIALTRVGPWSNAPRSPLR